MAEFDWAELQRLAEDEKFEPLPEAVYVFVVEKAAAKPSAKNTGINFQLQCKVMEGPEAGRSTFANIFVAKPGADVKAGAYSMMAAKLNAIGVPLSTLAAHGATPQQAATLFVGRTFLGGVAHREWNGATRDGIDTIAPLPGGGMPGMSGMPGAMPGMSGSANTANGASRSTSETSVSSAITPSGDGTSTSPPPKAPW